MAPRRQYTPQQITMHNTALITAGSRANRNRCGKRTLSTHWRTGTRGNTSSSGIAAVSTMRRAPQVGQNPRRLLLHATSCSA